MPTPVPSDSVRHTGGCLQPVLLRGRADYIDGGTGELIHRYTTVHEPGGVLPIACKTRRASRCPPCAEVYRADTYQLIRAGLTGGKGIPATVAEHPCVFVTLTALSFGPVHAHREKDGRILAYRPRRKGKICPHGIGLSCGEKHSRDNHRLGEPLCPNCYDYTGAVLFNACAPELWRRFHDYPPQASGAQRQANWPGPRRAGPGLLRQGRRIPAARRGPLPRHRPARRSRWANHAPARLGHACPAHRRHRPSRPRRAGAPGPHAGLGPPTRHPPGHCQRRGDRHQGRGVRGQVRH